MLAESTIVLCKLPTVRDGKRSQVLLRSKLIFTEVHVCLWSEKNVRQKLYKCNLNQNQNLKGT